MFKDVSKDHWAYEPIKALSDKGIINGYENNCFKPDEFITRAEAAAILSRMIEV